MPRTVRTVDAYYEASGPHAVPPAHAREVFGVATDIISKYVGPVALTSIRGARLPADDRPVNPFNLKLSEAPHTALLTGRATEAKGVVTPYGGATSYTADYNSASGSTIIATAPAVHLDNKGEIAADVLLHEFGHSFGLSHCAGSLCIMNSHVLYKVGATPNSFVTGRPFCDPCAGDLEIAGYMNIAAQL